MRRLGWPRRGLPLGCGGLLACVLNCMSGRREGSSVSDPTVAVGNSSGLTAWRGVELRGGAGEPFRECDVGETPLILGTAQVEQGTIPRTQTCTDKTKTAGTLGCSRAHRQVTMLLCLLGAG